MTNAALLATRYARRPLLIEPHAAEELANRVRALDDRAFARPGRFSALLRKVGLAGSAPRPLAMEDDEWSPPPPIEQRLAYAPLWAGDVEDTGYCWSLVQGVALMCADTPLVERGEDFCGVVYHGYDTLKAGIADAMADSRVGAIFLRLDSPGGVVAGGLPELARFIRSVRATGNAAGKPIWVYADMACSAAYWIAAQADKVLAPSVGLVGSIGAVLVHENWAGALAKEGVEITAIQFGAQKTAGAWWQALSGPARADFQAEIDQCGRDFVADVALGRQKLTSEALIGTEARVFMAAHDEPERSGLDLGFVDAISSEEDAFAALVALVRPGEVAVSLPEPPKSATATMPAPQPATEAPMYKSKAEAIASIDARIAKLSASASTAIGQVLALTGDPAKVPAGAAAKTRFDALQARTEDLSARKARLEATTSDPDDEDMADDEGTDPGAPDEDEDGDEDKPKAKEAAAIAASAEGKANPGLALAAIEKGLTLGQFQAMAQAAPTAKSKGGAGALRDFMAANPRLGPDGASASATPKKALFALAVADAEKKAAKAKGGTVN